jgi:hypothetical protein
MGVQLLGRADGPLVMIDKLDQFHHDSPELLRHETRPS